MTGIRVGDPEFRAVSEEKRAPRTVRALRELLPYKQQLIQARRTWEADMGQLGGNHFRTFVEGAGQLPEMGRRIVRKGAQPLRYHDGDVGCTGSPVIRLRRSKEPDFMPAAFRDTKRTAPDQHWLIWDGD